MSKDRDLIQAQESLNKFETWAGSMSDKDFVAIARGAKLNRIEIAKGASLARSTLNDNMLVKRSLLRIEKDLRARKILAPLMSEDNDDTGLEHEALYDQSAKQLKYLKAEVERLKVVCLNKEAENARLRSKLKQYAELSEVLSSSGIMPR